MCSEPSGSNANLCANESFKNSSMGKAICPYPCACKNCEYIKDTGNNGSSRHL